MTTTLYLLFITHFIADFILQTREMGQRKSKSLTWLIKHVTIIFICFLPFGTKFALANAAIHMLIDGLIWNIYKLSVLYRYTDKLVVWKHKVKLLDPQFKYYEDPIFYDTIGLDQLLHGLTLIYLAGKLL